MLRVGLTGGIGSGKSTVAKIFEVTGIPVYYADEAAKRLMNEDAVLKRSLIQHFGPDIYQEDRLNRPVLAKMVFGNPERVELLNSLVHPVTVADAEAWMQKQNSPYAIKEAALIFESDAYKYLDFVIGVKAPYALRLERAMKRDAITAEQVTARMKNQLAEDEKMNRCDFVITNDETTLLIPQVLEIHDTLVKRSTIEM